MNRGEDFAGDEARGDDLLIGTVACRMRIVFLNVRERPQLTAKEKLSAALSATFPPPPATDIALKRRRSFGVGTLGLTGSPEKKVTSYEYSTSSTW